MAPMFSKHQWRLLPKARAEHSFEFIQNDRVANRVSHGGRAGMIKFGVRFLENMIHHESFDLRQLVSGDTPIKRCLRD